MNVFVEAATLTPLCHDGQVVLSHVAHEQQDVNMSCFPAQGEEETTVSKVRNEDGSTRIQQC